MGGNDLNLKKSWHPQLMTNQRRVYDAEQAALQERKITEARIEEIRRERQIEETQKQLEAAGGPKRVDRVDWMYQGPNDGGRDEYSSEAFLLGKRRIDSILRGDDARKVAKTAGPTGEAAGPIPIVASARDTAAKIREDPLVAIKRQEQEAYQAMMKDPSKRRALLAQMGIAEKSRKHKEDRKHRSHRHRSHRHHDDVDDQRRRRRDSRSRDRSYSPKRRYDDSDGEQDRKRRPRRDSRSPSRCYSPKRRYDDSDGEQDRKRRPRRDSRSPSRSHSPKRRYDDSNEEQDRKRRRRSDSRDGAWDRRRQLDRVDRSVDRRDDRRDGWRGDRRDHRPSDGRNDSWRKRSWSPRRRHDSRDHRQGRPERPDDAEERARKLAAMQNAATDLDRVREERLAALAEKEKAEREADNEARARSQRYGGRDFAIKLYNSAADNLADRIGRGRQGLQRDDD